MNYIAAQILLQAEYRDGVYFGLCLGAAIGITVGFVLGLAV